MSYVVTGVCELFGVVWLFIPRVGNEFSICMLYVGTILWNLKKKYLGGTGYDEENFGGSFSH